MQKRDGGRGMNSLAPMDTLPVLIDRATAALDAARDSAEVLEARDMARVAYDAVKSATRIARAKGAHDQMLSTAYRLQADAAALEARAKIRFADEYDAAQERGEVAKRGWESGVDKRNTTTAADLGLRRDEIHEARMERAMDLSKGTVGAQDVAKATGTTPKQITNWCNQGHVLGQKTPLGKGRRREFTFANVMEIAVAVALMQHGVQSPADAFRAAMKFAHVGSSHGGWVNDKGEIVENPPRPVRKVSFPYHFLDGETFLIISGERAEVVLVEKGVLDLYSVFPELARPPAVFIAVNVTEVFKAVITNMGEDWRVFRDAERENPGLIRRALDAMVSPEPTADDPAPRPIEPTKAALRRAGHFSDKKGGSP